MHAVLLAIGVGIALLRCVAADAEVEMSAWPGSSTQRVVGYLFDDGGKSLLGANAAVDLDRLRRTQQAEATLQPSQVEALLSAAFHAPSDDLGNFCIYQPHHVFVFYDQAGGIAAAIEICFQCRQMGLSPIPGRKTFRRDFPKLKDLCRELRIFETPEMAVERALKRREWVKRQMVDRFWTWTDGKGDSFHLSFLENQTVRGPWRSARWELEAGDTLLLRDAGGAELATLIFNAAGDGFLGYTSIGQSVIGLGADSASIARPRISDEERERRYRDWLSRQITDHAWIWTTSGESGMRVSFRRNGSIRGPWKSTRWELGDGNAITLYDATGAELATLIVDADNGSFDGFTSNGRRVRGTGVKSSSTVSAKGRDWPKTKPR